MEYIVYNTEPRKRHWHPFPFVQGAPAKRLL